MKKIRWGIIGCGNVTEVKSGPACKKVKNSELVAVMRRDAEKAQDYAIRHRVSRWYSNAIDLINDPEINAVYIATPPDSHEKYALAAMQAGKPVYLEKPMSVNATSAANIAGTSVEYGTKLCDAHYRPYLPQFLKIWSILDQKQIG